MSADKQTAESALNPVEATEDLPADIAQGISGVVSSTEHKDAFVEEKSAVLRSADAVQQAEGFSTDTSSAEAKKKTSAIAATTDEKNSTSSPDADECEEVPIDTADVAEKKFVLLERAFSRLNSLAEHVASQPVGQTLFRQADNLLSIVEKSIKWTLQPTDSTEPVVRPLPWIFFMPLLVVLKVTNIAMKLGAPLVGKGQLHPQEVVTCIRSQRRNLRAIKFQGIHNMNINMENESQGKIPLLETLLFWWPLTLITKVFAFVGLGSHIRSSSKQMLLEGDLPQSLEATPHSRAQTRVLSREEIIKELNELSENSSSDPDFEPNEMDTDSGSSSDELQLEDEDDETVVAESSSDSTTVVPESSSGSATSSALDMESRHPSKETLCSTDINIHMPAEDSSKNKSQELSSTAGDKQEEDSSKNKSQELSSAAGDKQEEDSSKNKLQELSSAAGDKQEEDSSKNKSQELSSAAGDKQEEDSSKNQSQELSSTAGDKQEEDSPKNKSQELTSAAGDKQEEDSPKNKSQEPSSTAGGKQEEDSSIQEKPKKPFSFFRLKKT